MISSSRCWFAEDQSFKFSLYIAVDIDDLDCNVVAGLEHAAGQGADELTGHGGNVALLLEKPLAESGS